MAKTCRFKVSSTAEGDWQRLAFSGAINEDAKVELMALTSSAGAKCILDLGAVTLINSCGVRDWSTFLRAFKTGRAIVFDNCTDEIVRTMNMVTNFHDRLPVRSVFRAYGCEHCGHEQLEHLYEGQHYRVGELPQGGPVLCAACGEQSEAFESDTEFFQFLQSA